MALTFTPVSSANNGSVAVGNKRQNKIDITYDSSYPDNGEAVTAANVGLRKIDNAWPISPVARSSDGATAVLTSWDATNSKILAYESATTGVVFPEKGDTESIDGYVQRWIFEGH